MATQPIAPSVPGVGGRPSGMRYVARQPILDLRGRVHGYELLFRSGPEAAFSGDGNVATRTMLDNTVLFGLENLTAGLPAFVNCTLESLTEQLVDILPPSMTVLEILETIEPTPDLIAACRKLKALGFRLALDDFIWKPKFEPLIDLANYIKVDFSLSDAAERQDLLRRLSHRAVAMLAEKVETQQEYQQARNEGFTLFQGYYFCFPELIQNAKVPSNRLFHLDILRQLHRDPLDLKKISPLVLRDASLTYRLLRLVNSPIYALRQQVSSIAGAILVVGETAFRRIATLAILSEFNAEQPPEILHMALVRARFCELAAALCGLDPDEQYLLGMMSLLPAMMRFPMEALVPELPLRDEIRQALLGLDNRERCLLAWIEGHERNDQAASHAIAEHHALNQQRLVQFFIDAVVWDATAHR